MSRTVIDLDDEALAFAAEELGTKTKVATVNAALRQIANHRAARRMVEAVSDFGLDLSPEGMRGAWR